jgi:hypothetical protein
MQTPDAGKQSVATMHLPDSSGVEERTSVRVEVTLRPDLIIDDLTALRHKVGVHIASIATRSAGRAGARIYEGAVPLEQEGCGDGFIMRHCVRIEVVDIIENEHESRGGVLTCEAELDIDCFILSVDDPECEFMDGDGDDQPAFNSCVLRSSDIPSGPLWVVSLTLVAVQLSVQMVITL